MKLKNNINPISLVKTKFPVEINTSGRLGIIKRRVRKTERSAGSINMKAVLYSIKLFLMLMSVPIAAENPTTNME